MKRIAFKQCAASLMMEAKGAKTSDLATGMWIGARRVMSFAGFAPNEINEVCGKESPRISNTPESEEGRPYVD